MSEHVRTSIMYNNFVYHCCHNHSLSIIHIHYSLGVLIKMGMLDNNFSQSVSKFKLVHRHPNPFNFLCAVKKIGVPGNEPQENSRAPSFLLIVCTNIYNAHIIGVM